MLLWLITLVVKESSVPFGKLEDKALCTLGSLTQFVEWVFNWKVVALSCHASSAIHACWNLRQPLIRVVLDQQRVEYSMSEYMLNPLASIVLLILLRLVQFTSVILMTKLDPDHIWRNWLCYSSAIVISSSHKLWLRYFQIIPHSYLGLSLYELCA